MPTCRATHGRRASEGLSGYKASCGRRTCGTASRSASGALSATPGVRATWAARDAGIRTSLAAAGAGLGTQERRCTSAAVRAGLGSFFLGASVLRGPSHATKHAAEPGVLECMPLAARFRRSNFRRMRLHATCRTVRHGHDRQRPAQDGAIQLNRNAFWTSMPAYRVTAARPTSGNGPGAGRRCRIIRPSPAAWTIFPEGTRVQVCVSAIGVNQRQKVDDQRRKRGISPHRKSRRRFEQRSAVRGRARTRPIEATSVLKQEQNDHCRQQIAGSGHRLGAAGFRQACPASPIPRAASAGPGSPAIGRRARC